MKIIIEFINKIQEEGVSSALRAIPHHLVEKTLCAGPDSITTPLTEYVYSYDVENYRNSPDPHTPIYVSPNTVFRFTGRRWPPWKNKKQQLGQVMSGDWDTKRPEISEQYLEYKDVYELFRADSFEESTFYKYFEERYLQGKDWVDTDFVSQCLELADGGIPSWKGFDTREDILNHCERVDNLFETICENGYMSQSELGKIRYPRDVCREVCIDIGRDGRLLFVNGRHRLAIAKLLNIDKIPVCVLVRHIDWMNKRSQKNGMYIKHPDT